MPNIPIPVAGPTYSSRSKPVSAQRTRNLYPEVDQSSENIISLVPFPGLKPWGTTGTGQSRGVCVYNNELYAITEGALYKVDDLGSPTSIGSISGSGRCNLEEDNSKLIIATGSSKPYSYDGTNLTLGTDSDLANSSTVSYIRNRVVYDGNNADAIFADLGNALSVDSSNVTSVDTKPGDVLAVRAFKDQLFVFGEDFITPYYNSGVGNPPYSVIQNATETELGLGAIHSVATGPRGMYFLGSDNQPYKITGIQAEPIGNPSIGQAIQSYSTKANAYGICFNFNNDFFYMLTFPGNATWMFCERSGMWVNLAYQQDGDPHLAYDYAYCYGKHLVSDRLSGNIYELDFDTFTDNGQSIDRQRDTIKISGKSFGVPGKEIFMDKLELVVETGTGIISGQGSNPKVMMSFSDDGGKTWSPEQWAEFGAMGSFAYSNNPTWQDLGSFYERQFRFRVSDPVKFVIVSANAEVSVGV